MILLVAALVLQSPAVDTLRDLATRLSPESLAIEVRSRTQVVRETITDALARSVRSPGRAEAELALARDVARAYEETWKDAFLSREVDRFSRWPAGRRVAKVRADSLRRVGVDQFRQEGAATAIRTWRRGLVWTARAADSAGTAALLGNIGSGLIDLGHPDSASSYLRRAAALAAQVGDLRVEANATGELANLSREANDLSGARAEFARALALRQRIGDSRGIAADQNNLGLLARDMGDLVEAGRRFEQALDMNRAEGREEVAATNLVNLAGLAAMEGDFARAERLYRDALVTWRDRGMWAETAHALDGLGQLELRRGDYPAAIAALGEAVAAWTRVGELPGRLSAEQMLATAEAARGDPQGAFTRLTRAQQLADSSGAPPRVVAGLALARADLATSLNALDDADRLYQRASVLARQSGDQGLAAEASHGRGYLLLLRDEPERAEALFDVALGAQVAARNRRGAALTRLALGQSAAAKGDSTTARRQLDRAVRELVAVGDPVAASAAMGERAWLESVARPAVADSLFRLALERLGRASAPEVEWRLRAGLGMTQRRQGRLEEASRSLRTAIDILRQPAGSFRLAERRAAYLADKWDVFAELALAEQGRGRPAAAFEASEGMRAREFVELLDQGRIDARGSGPGDILTREQDLRRRLRELSGEATAGRPPTVLRGSGGDTPVGARLSALQDAYQEVLLEARERNPRLATVLSEYTADWRKVAARLEPDQALIEFLLSESSSLAFVVVRDSIAVIDLGLPRGVIAPVVSLARGFLDHPPTSPVDSLWRTPLRRLHAQLIAPIEATGLLAGRRRLVVVPHLELHYLPFAALIEDEGGGFLVERYDITYAPSATAWVALTESSPAGRRGVLALAPQAEALPGALREVGTIGRLAGPGTTVLRGPAATEAAFHREAGKAGVIHLATIGVLNKSNPLFSFVELAPGGGEDGHLEVHEVLGLSLSADLVVLSACQTALGSGRIADVPPGDDWVGLTRAFLHAGAAQVAATLWAIEDRATAVLMERFYRQLGTGEGAAHALAVAQRELLSQRATAHPFHWAGFVVLGAPRGRAPIGSN